MSSTSVFPFNSELPQWLTITLITLNVFATFVCILNIVHLCKQLPPGNQLYTCEEQEMKNMKCIMPPTTETKKGYISMKQDSTNIQDECSTVIEQKMSSSDDINDDIFKLHRYKIYVKRYFYLMSIVPIMTGYISHYGATYPLQGIWIFPIMNLIIGMSFIGFIQLMIQSCDGWSTIRKHLWFKKDNVFECTANELLHKIFYKQMTDDQKCKNEPLIKEYDDTQSQTIGECRCCGFMLHLLTRDNLFKGLRFRLKFAYIILVKPIIAYMLTYSVYYGTKDEVSDYFSMSLKVMTFITTILPMQAMKIFFMTVQPYSRISRTGIKLKFVIFLAPLVQLQETVVKLLISTDSIQPFKNIDKDLRWCPLFGTLLCAEMAIMTCLVTSIAFNPKDLFTWHTKVREDVMNINLEYPDLVQHP